MLHRSCCATGIVSPLHKTVENLGCGLHDRGTYATSKISTWSMLHRCTHPQEIFLFATNLVIDYFIEDRKLLINTILKPSLSLLGCLAARKLWSSLFTCLGAKRRTETEEFNDVGNEMPLLCFGESSKNCVDNAVMSITQEVFVTSKRFTHRYMKFVGVAEICVHNDISPLPLLQFSESSTGLLDYQMISSILYNTH
jgi:hypothetical protein